MAGICKHIKGYRKIVLIYKISTNTKKPCNFRKNSTSKISNSSQLLIEEKIIGDQVISK